MKRKRLLISAIIFFLVVNTSHFWSGIIPFPWDLLLFLLLVILYGVLIVALVLQVAYASEEKARDKQRYVTIAVVALVIILVGYRPGGMIDFERFESKDLLIAQREGVANCMTTFKLKEDKTFRERSVCFGVKKKEGKYSIHNDTITFSAVDKDFYKFAVIKPSDSLSGGNIGDLVLYRNVQDTTPLKLWITINELIPN
ncbi:MAG TPA: hypothetical protein VGE79_18440 [Niastella sp.]